MASLRIEIRDNQLLASGALQEKRPFGQADRQWLKDLSRRARLASTRFDGTAVRGAEERTLVEEQTRLLELGESLTGWLNGSQQWVTRWLELRGPSASASASSDASAAPELEIRAPFPDSTTADHWALLDAPWELLTGLRQSGSEVEFLSSQTPPLIVYRRLTRPGEIETQQPPIPEHALTVLFMAACPEGQASLDYETEERAILDATRDLPLDLLVEETGTAAELGKRLSELTFEPSGTHGAAPVQVVHLSCHGRPSQAEEQQPTLLLEDALGREAPVNAEELTRALACDVVPQLVVLSACLSAAGGDSAGENAAMLQGGGAAAMDAVEPLALELLRSWAPAVIGFADSVADLEATCFAALLYRELSDGETLERAVAWTRQQMLAGSLRRQSSSSTSPVTPAGSGAHASETGEATSGALEALLACLAERGSRNWHAARLMLTMNGGGAVASPKAARRVLRRLPHGFLDYERRMPIAGPERFVGRRRELREAMRVLTAAELQPSGPLLVRGVLIHGPGGVGKSSLAARIAQRMVSHRTAVVLGDYSVRGVLAAIRSALGAEAPDWLGTQGARRVHPRLQPLAASADPPDADQDAADLERSLHRLFASVGRDQAQDDPILLVLDDLERILVADESSSSRGRHRVAPSHEAVMRAILRAFGYAESTRSCLLITSRFAFTLPDWDGSELADVLWPLPLASMSEHESRKQANAAGLTAAVGDLAYRCVQLAQGNPALLSLLLTLSTRDEKSCIAALSQMEQFLQGGEEPDHDGLRTFFERVAVEGLLGSLSAAECQLVRGSAVFEIPVPLAVVPGLCGAVGLDEATDWQRLVDLGAWEVHSDAICSTAAAVLVSRLMRPWVIAEAIRDGQAEHEERARIARAVLAPLLEAWAPIDEKVHVSVAHQLFAVALAAGDAAAILRFAVTAFDWLLRVGRTKDALHHASTVMALASDREIPATVLRACANLAELEGDLQRADLWREQAIARLSSVNLSQVRDLETADLVLDHARALEHRGRQQESVSELEKALNWIDAERFPSARAVLLNDIARNRHAKGEVDAAVGLYEQAKALFELNGQPESRAIVLLNLGQIYREQGDSARALGLYEEVLYASRNLDGLRLRGLALMELARLAMFQNDISRPLPLLLEALAIFEQLADVLLRAHTQLLITEIRLMKGDVAQALVTCQEVLAVCGKFRQVRLHAPALIEMARILKWREGGLDESLRLCKEALAVCDKVGDAVTRAVALKELADVYGRRGEFEQALRLQRERLAVLERQGDVLARAVTLREIATLLDQRGERKQALGFFEEALGVFEALDAAGEGALTRERLAFAKRTTRGQRLLSLVDQVEVEMRSLSLWDTNKPEHPGSPLQYSSVESVSFAQWLHWAFLDTVREHAVHGTPLASSTVVEQARRELGRLGALGPHVERLVELLGELEAVSRFRPKVARLGFFEAGTQPNSHYGRELSERFERAHTRRVAGHLELEYDELDRALELEIGWRLTGPNEFLLSAFLDRTILEQGWTQSYYWRAVGSDQAGGWWPGWWTLTLTLWDEPLASARFLIAES